MLISVAKAYLMVLALGSMMSQYAHDVITPLLGSPGKVETLVPLRMEAPFEWNPLSQEKE